MRTTLKRGIGRGANGNGRAVLPPGSLSPVTLYRTPLPPKPGFARLVGRFFLWLALTIVVLVSGLVGGFYLWAHEKAFALGCQSASCERAAQRLDTIKDPHQPAIALVIGYDHRAGDGNSPSRSDTMMLIRADPSTKTISLLSLPRDLDVPIYCPSRTASGRNNGPAVVYDHGRINSAYAFCGPTGSLETVKHLTGLPINYLISVNFLGFIAVVNKLGGVWMDVDRRYYNRNIGTGSTDFANIDLQPGYQLMNGRQALSFVRFRHTDSDLFRLARQQEFVGALRQQASHSLGLRSVISLVNTITDHHYVEVGIGGGGHVNLGTLEKYAGFAHGLPPGHVFQNKISGLTGYNELFASQSSIDQAVQSFLNPDVQAPAQETAVALGRKLHHKFTLPPSKVTLTVLNGNGVAGSAANASYLLAQKGYQIKLPPSNQPANAPNWNYFHSKAYFDSSRGACKGAAQGVAKLVGSTDVEPRPAKIGPLANGACVVVVVGSTFHDRLAPVIVRAGSHASAAVHPLRPGRDATDAGGREETCAVPAPAADGARAQLQPRLRLRRDAASRLLARRPSDRSPHLPHGRERVLGHPGVRLDGRAGAVRPKPDAAGRGPALRPVLHRLEPAHGRAPQRERELLGREHAARLALERDDAGDRAWPAADDSLGSGP